MIKVVSCLLGIILILAGCGDGTNDTNPLVNGIETDTYTNIVDMKQYFPLAIGNTWTYRDIANGVSTTSVYKHFVQKIVTLDIDGQKYFDLRSKELPIIKYAPAKVAGENPDPLVGFYRYNGNEVLVTYGEEVGTYLSAQDIVSRESVTVPAGTFNCIKITKGFPDSPVMLWYAAGIGKVKTDHGIVETTKGSVHLFSELTSYSIK